MLHASWQNGQGPGTHAGCSVQAAMQAKDKNAQLSGLAVECNLSGLAVECNRMLSTS